VRSSRCLSRFLDAAYEFETFHVEEDLHVSLDWGDFTANAASSSDYKLYRDTGANIDISPCREDFVTFTPISPPAVKGFQGRGAPIRWFPQK
jgi:hypothetical protein